MSPPKGRGGPRRGAGAPRGNKNAWVHGRYAANQRLRRALSVLPEEVRAELMPYVREGAAAIERRLGWLDRRPENVIDLPPSSSSSSTEQSDRLQHLALRMTSHGFLGAQGFLRQHFPHVAEIEGVVDGFDAHTEDVYAGFDSSGATLNQAIHLAIAEGYGTALRCPHCRWNMHEKRKEATS